MPVKLTSMSPFNCRHEVVTFQVPTTLPPQGLTLVQLVAPPAAVAPPLPVAPPAPVAPPKLPCWPPVACPFPSSELLPQAVPNAPANASSNDALAGPKCPCPMGEPPKTSIILRGSIVSTSFKPIWGSTRD